MRTAAFGKTSGGKRMRFDDDESSAAHQKAPAAAAPRPLASPAHPSDAVNSYHVQTSLDASGSEVPSRLNNKVFIDGLPFNHDPAKHEHKTLEELMAQYLADWKVGKMMHMTKKPGQGFAYVAFRSPNSVEVAIKVLNGRKFLGRPLRVELPKTAKAPMTEFQARHSDINSTVDRQVLITDLAKIAEPEIIRQVLRDVAPQLEAKIEAIKVTSNNRKAFLTLASSEDVDFAVGFLNGYQLLGRTIGATRAMAPGSLPFSKRAPPTTPPTGAPTGYGDESEAAAVSPAAAAMAAGKKAAALPPPTAAQQADEDDEEDLPLGVAPTKTAAAAAAKKPAAAAAAAPAPAAAAPAKPAGSAALTKADMEKRQVFVGGISEDTTEGMLRQHFANCGIIRSVKIVTNPHTHQSAGVAIVTFAMPSSGEFAIRNLNGSLLNGNLIRVDREDGEAVDSDRILAPKLAGGAKRLDGQKEAKQEEAIDTDAFFKARGIKNPNAYFASVPGGAAKQAVTAAPAAEEKKKKFDMTMHPDPEVALAAAIKEERKQRREEREAKLAARKEPAAPIKKEAVAVVEKKKAAAAAPSAEDKKALRKEKEEKANKTAPTPSPIAKNVVSFEYDDADVYNKRPTGGDDNDSDEEERFVDVGVNSAKKTAAKKFDKKAGGKNFKKGGGKK